MTNTEANDILGALDDFQREGLAHVVTCGAPLKPIEDVIRQHGEERVAEAILLYSEAHRGALKTVPCIIVENHEEYQAEGVLHQERQGASLNVLVPDLDAAIFSIVAPGDMRDLPAATIANNITAVRINADAQCVSEYTYEKKVCVRRGSLEHAF